MKIDIKAYGFDPDNSLNHFTNCCVGFELGAQRRQIESVLIHVAHAPEPQDENNRHCLVEVDLYDGQRIITRDANSDLHVAIYRALERAGQMSARRQLPENREADGLPIPLPYAPNTGEPNRAA